jgi:serine/threonine protein kinase
MACPDESSLSEFIARVLPATAAARIEAHLADCPDCRRLVFTLASSGADAGDTPAQAERISRFEILDEIGHGAMGVVYRARDPELDRTVAIKVLRARKRLDVDGEDRLRREAQALARLAHPNVVTVYECGRAGDVAYVAMELVEGPTLDVWLATKPPTADIVRVLVEAGRGLAAAHAAGLVHRDFKPHNIFVAQKDGTAKVGDFGLVRAERELAAPASSSDLMMTLSISGALVGTPAYMSPEQLRGETATEASDQFSFCVTLFEALYARRPFVGLTVAELTRAMEQPLVVPRSPRTRRRSAARSAAGSIRIPRAGSPPWRRCSTSSSDRHARAAGPRSPSPPEPSQSRRSRSLSGAAIRAHASIQTSSARSLLRASRSSRTR